MAKEVSGMSKNARQNRSWFQAYFKNLWPVFAGDEEAIGLGVVGDAVHDVEVAGIITRAKNAVEIDNATEFASVGIDAGDVEGLPDIGKDFAFDEFEFVEASDGLIVVIDAD